MSRTRGKQFVDTTLVGAGTLATALAIALRSSGHRVLEIVARDNPRSISHARTLAKRVGANATTLSKASFTAKVTWICAPDDAISEVADRIAARSEWKRKIAVHSSGALDSDVLASLKKAGANTASAHPLMTFVSSSKSELVGVPFAMEGDPKALAVVRAIVRSIGGNPFRIAADLKPAYHLFGFFSSPALVALMAAAQKVGELAGLNERKSRELMEPIIRRTIDNCFRSAPQQAFSGPLRRGDIATLRKHLEVLRQQPELLAVYKSLSHIALEHLPVGDPEQVKKLIG